MKTILFQGDSITDTGRNCNNGSLLDIGQGYALICGAKLGTEKPQEYQIINKGISGNRIVDLYARIKADFWNLNPDVLSILIGVNDVWHDIWNNGVESDRFYNIYKLLLSETIAKFPNLKIMMLEPFILEGEATSEHWEKFKTRVDENARIVKELAGEFNAKFVPLQSVFDNASEIAPKNYWLGDGVHPTIFGHQLIADEWLKAFKELDV